MAAVPLVVLAAAERVAVAPMAVGRIGAAVAAAVLAAVLHGASTPCLDLLKLCVKSAKSAWFSAPDTSP